MLFELITLPAYIWSPDKEKSSCNTSSPGLCTQLYLCIMLLYHVY